MDSSRHTRGEEGWLAGGIDRRDFLQALGIGGLLSLQACERIRTRRAIPFLVAPEEVTPGASLQYASTCLACPAACGLLVTARDGRPIKLEGRPGQPISRGGLCALGQAEVRGLYDDARLRSPRLNAASSTWARVDEAVRSGLAGNKGKLYLVASHLSGPTAHAVAERFVGERGGTLVEWEPGCDDARAVRAAYGRLDGAPLLPSLRFEAADVVLSLAADFLGTGRDPVGATYAYAARRRDGGRPALRHLHLEGTRSLTGAAADERIAATAAERRRAIAWLLGRVAAKSAHLDARAVAAALGPAPEPTPFADRLARWSEEIIAAQGRVLVLSGSADPDEQLAVALLVRLLGGEGHTLDLERPVVSAGGATGDVAAFRADLTAGRVGAVFFLEVDPVDDWPDGGELGAAIARVGLSVAISTRASATAEACKVVAAAHHRLERWDEAQPRADLLCLAQPTLRPLFGTRHPMSCLLAWLGEADRDPRKRIRARWRRELWPAFPPAEPFARFWERALREGQVAVPEMSPTPLAAVEEAAADDAPATRSAETDAPAAAAAAGAAPGKPPAPPAGAARLASLAVLGRAASPAGYQVELAADVGVRAGRGTANPWLRELPDPITRVSYWTASATVAPTTARTLGIGNGDVVSIGAGTRRVELPVSVVPGQHPQVVGVPLGYGKRDGDGGREKRMGARLASLVAGEARWRGLPVKLAPAGRAERLPRVQWEGSTHEREVVHQVSAPGERAVEPPEDLHSLWSERGRGSPQWHMVIDLDACTGCAACVVACQAENNLPVVGPGEIASHRDLYWLRIDRYFAGDAEDADLLFEPMLCAQCEHAPCETVCPVAATMHSADGLNEQVYNRCIGTRYCANNCPYKVRRFNWFDYDRGSELERLVLNPDVVVRERGVMEKCTFCVQRIQLARIETRAGQSHGEVATACQQSCPARAITFGDATDPEGAVRRAASSPRAFQVLADLGVRPSVTYLAHVRNRQEEPS